MTLEDLPPKAKVQYAILLIVTTALTAFGIMVGAYYMILSGGWGTFFAIIWLVVSAYTWRLMVWPAMLYTYTTGKAELAKQKRR